MEQLPYYTIVPGESKAEVPRDVRYLKSPERGQVQEKLSIYRKVYLREHVYIYILNMLKVNQTNWMIPLRL